MEKLKLKKTYKAYPEYKDSGVEWLGDIPKEWKIYRAKNLFKKMDRSPKEFDEIITAFRDGVVTLRKNRREDGFTMADKEIGYQRIEKGDLVIHGMDAFAGAIGVSDSEGKSSPVYSACIPTRGSDPKYHAYLLRHMSKSKYIFALAKGIRERSTEFRFKEFSNLEVVEPTYTEQVKIGKYLDEKTLLLDKTIENKIRLIETLKEKRTSVINSSIINAGGEKGKLKNYIQLNPSKKGISATAPEDMVSFVPMEAISEMGELQLQERKYQDVNSGFAYFKNGDVVLAKITPCYENGKAGVMKGLKNDFGFGTTEFMVLRPSNKILADYLYYVVFSDKFRKMGEVEMRGTAGQKRVTSSFVMNYELSIPVIKTQEKIVAELNKKIKLFDVAIAKVETSISYLKEFKTSLISNVVTGKIKV